MKRIYNNIIKISIPISMLIMLNGCSKLAYQEDKIYTEGTVAGYSKNSIKEKKKNNIRREEAIEKALDVLNNGFKENLHRESLYESVNLININDDFFWKINFTEHLSKSKENNYYVGIDAEYGDINDVIISKYKEKDISNIENKVYITEEEIKESIKSLADTLNINIDNYEIFIKKEYVQLVDTKNKKLKYEFLIDVNSKKIIGYYKEK